MPLRGSVDNFPALPEVYAPMPAMPKLRAPAPVQQQAPVERILYNPATKKLSVDGFVFSEDDDASALEAASLLAQPPASENRSGEGWVPVPAPLFEGLVNDIRNPSKAKLARKNFALGWRSMQELLGRGLQFLGAESYGQSVVDSAQEGASKLAPYQRSFAEAKRTGGYGDYIAGTIGQAIPSALTIAGGAVAGAVAAPVVGAAAATGAALGAGAVGVGMGVGDTFGEMREKGVDTSDPSARLTAAGAGALYGATSLVGPAVAVTAFKGIGRKLAKEATEDALKRSFTNKALRTGAAVAGAGGAGAVAEGLAERGQEAIVIGAAERMGAEYTPEERAERLLEATAAGAVAGGALGAGARGLRTLSRRPSATQAIVVEEAPAEPVDNQTDIPVSDIIPPAEPVVAPVVQGPVVAPVAQEPVAAVEEPTPRPKKTLRKRTPPLEQVIKQEGETVPTKTLRKGPLAAAMKAQPVSDVVIKPSNPKVAVAIEDAVNTVQAAVNEAASVDTLASMSSDRLNVAMQTVALDAVQEEAAAQPTTAEPITTQGGAVVQPRSSAERVRRVTKVAIQTGTVDKVVGTAERARAQPSKADTERAQIMFDGLVRLLADGDTRADSYAQQFAEAAKRADPYTLVNNNGQLGPLREFLNEQGAPNIVTKTDVLGKQRRVLMRRNITPDETTANPVSLETGKVLQPLSKTQLQDVAKKFKAKLQGSFRRNVTVYVFDSPAQMQQANPRLYSKALAANPELATVDAYGYAFGKEVILFRENIFTENQARFVIAHEVLGHIGLRAMVEPTKLNEVLRQIANRDRAIKDAAEQKQELYEIPYEEAIEEALADYAAQMEMSAFKRIGNMLKTAMNQLGVKFEDDLTRQIIYQIRRFARDGKGSVISEQTLRENANAVNQLYQTGRFMRVATPTIQELGVLGGNFNSSFSPRLDDFRADAAALFRGGRDTISRAIEWVETKNNQARRSEGMAEVYKIYSQTAAKVNEFMSEYNEITKNLFKYYVPRLAEDGMTEQNLATVSQMLSAATLARAQNNNPMLIRRLVKTHGELIRRNARGRYEVNEALVKAAKKAGEVTLEDFRTGVKVPYPDGSGTYTVKFPNLTENSKEWQGFVAAREAVARAAVNTALAKANAYEDQRGYMDKTVRTLVVAEGGVVSDAHMDVLFKVSDIYNTLYTADPDYYNGSPVWNSESIAKANRFNVEFIRTLYEPEKVRDWLDPASQEGVQEFRGPEYQFIVDNIADMAAAFNLKNKKNVAFAIQRAINDLQTADVNALGEQDGAIGTIAGAYAPLLRNGKYQLSVAVTDAATGKTVAMDSGMKATLPYFQEDSRVKIERLARDLDGLFGDKAYEALDEYGSPVLVKLKPVISETRQVRSIADRIDPNELSRMLTRLNITITPAERARITKAITDTHAKARQRLPREGVPGWDKDVVRGVAGYLETQAHVAAKLAYRYRLNDIMANDRLWRGDERKLNQLKAAMDAAPDGVQKTLARQKYEQYAYMYLHMAEGKTVEIDGKLRQTLGQGERLRTSAQALIDFFEDSGDQTDNDLVSRLKNVTVLLQLGGQLSSPILNMVSFLTHTVPYLATYNSSRGFGGGFGFSKASAAAFSAMRHVGSYKLADPAFMKQVAASDKLRKQYNLTKDEAEFLAEQSARGVTQANQQNALIGTVRSGVRSNRTQAGIKAWMSMFAYTEQAVRRATALAAYRLQKDRLRAAGISETELTTDTARRQELYDFVVDAVTNAQGDYSTPNRIRAAYNNYASLLFLYQQFVITTLQLMRNLPPSGRAAMLGLILLMSGVKGLPFFDDLADIIDSTGLVDKATRLFGVRTPQVETALREMIDDIAPGATPYVMRGIFDRMGGVSVSTRTGFGNVLPLTEILRPGNDTWRTVSDAFGPMYSAFEGVAQTTMAVAQYGGEALGIGENTSSIRDIMRNVPAAGVRALFDAMAYYQDGVITNNRGQVVSNEVSIANILSRALGFFPGVATEQNDLIRLQTRTLSYAREVRVRYTQAYVRAHVEKDEARKRQILADVAEWNELARGTSLEFKNFQRSALRAARAGEQIGLKRFGDTVPVAARRDFRKLMEMQGIEY